MRAIWKFAVPILDAYPLEVPEGATFLPTVKCGDDSIFLWAVVDTEAKTTTRTIYVVGTGNPMPEGAKNYIGTGFQSFFVWHVFEDNRVAMPTKEEHHVKVNIVRDDDGDPVSWDVAICGCDRPWRHEETV